MRMMALVPRDDVVARATDLIAVVPTADDQVATAVCRSAGRHRPHRGPVPSGGGQHDIVAGAAQEQVPAACRRRRVGFLRVAHDDIVVAAVPADDVVAGPALAPPKLMSRPGLPTITSLPGAPGDEAGSGDGGERRRRFGIVEAGGAVAGALLTSGRMHQQRRQQPARAYRAPQPTASSSRHVLAYRRGSRSTPSPRSPARSTAGRPARAGSGPHGARSASRRSPVPRPIG